MKPGIIEDVAGRRCAWNRTIEKRPNPVDVLASIREVVERELAIAKATFFGFKPSKAFYNRICGERLVTTFKKAREHGVIVSENKRTVWIRFGALALTKVKKSRVMVLVAVLAMACALSGCKKTSLESYYPGTWCIHVSRGQDYCGYTKEEAREAAGTGVIYKEQRFREVVVE